MIFSKNHIMGKDVLYCIYLVYLLNVRAMELNSISKKNLSVLIKFIKKDYTYRELSRLTGLGHGSLNNWMRQITDSIGDAHIAQIAAYIGANNELVEDWLSKEYENEEVAIATLDNRRKNEKDLNFVQVRELISKFFYKASVYEIEEIIGEGVKHLIRRSLPSRDNNGDISQGDTMPCFFDNEIDWERLGIDCQKDLLKVVKKSLPKNIKSGDAAAKYFGISPDLFWGLWDLSPLSPMGKREMDIVAQKCKNDEGKFYNSWDELLQDLRYCSVIKDK